MIKSSHIKVGVKIKPTTDGQSIIKQENNEGKSPTLFLNLPNKDDRKFRVDVVHDANLSSATTFSDLQINKLAEKFLNGFNVCVMAYGQTGAGKTYAMEGSAKEPGIIKECITMIYDNKVSLQDSDCSIKCSYMQLYNEKIFDMLSENYINSDHLKLRWESQRDFVVENLSLHDAVTPSQMLKIWKKGNKNRVMASNKIHDMSSRSHAIFSISMVDKDEDGNFRERQMHFVDLAGSQKMADESGKLSKESIEINKSLFALRKVIKSLEEATVDRRQIHIPYRDSKLTSLLKKALGGNCLTMMIACIDSTASHKEETLLTLNYAVSTGRIKNCAKINMDSQAFEVKRLKKENEGLKKQLEAAMRQVDMLTKQHNIEAERKSMNEYSHKIIECIGTIRELIKSNKQLREQLDEERSLNNQQKLQIQMLMQEKYMAKRLGSLHESPDFSDHRYKKSNSVFETPYDSPPRLLKLRSGSNNKTYLPADIPRGSMNKHRLSTINKRKKYIVHRTEPDQFQP